MKRPRAPKATRRRRRRKKPAAGRPAFQLSTSDLHLGLARRVEGLPRDLGVVLLGLGAVGIAIPGPIPPGASFILLGAIFLFPRWIARRAGPLARRFPRLFRLLIGFVEGLRRALERRYPGSVAC